MKLILMGCEYTGKRTLGREIVKWWAEQTGRTEKWHDHFTPPFSVQDNPTTLAAEENEQIANLLPSLQEKFQRYQVSYHLGFEWAHDEDMWAINLHYGDAVYAPLYYGYGEAGTFGDRRFLARLWDHRMLGYYPHWILVMTKASPEVVLRRMREHPRPKWPVKEQDVELVLRRFEEEFNESLIERRFVLDTTDAPVERTLEEFVQQITPLLSETDRWRLASHRLQT